MRYFSIIICLFFILVFNQCANAPGSLEGSTGSAALSLALKEDALNLTQDNYALTYSTFAFNFSQITLDSESVSETFTADFFDEEITDVVELEDLSAGEYEGVTLTLAQASSLSGGSKVLSFAVSGESVTQSLNGLSGLIIASAMHQSSGDSCTLRIEFDATPTITVSNDEDNHVEVSAGEEAEILVEVDTDTLFAGLDLPSTCKDGAAITISASENATLASSIESSLTDAFVLESTEGHGHDHDH